MKLLLRITCMFIVGIHQETFYKSLEVWTKWKLFSSITVVFVSNGRMNLISCFVLTKVYFLVVLYKSVELCVQNFLLSETRLLAKSMFKLFSGGNEVYFNLGGEMSAKHFVLLYICGCKYNVLCFLLYKYIFRLSTKHKSLFQGMSFPQGEYQILVGYKVVLAGQIAWQNFIQLLRAIA